FAGVAAFGRGAAGLVGLEIALARPGGAADALQARIGPVAAAVGRRRPSDGGAVADELGVRQVGSAARVLPHDLALAGDVLVDGEFPGTDLDGGITVGGMALVVDEFELERLVRHALTGLVLGDDDAVE